MTKSKKRSPKKSGSSKAPRANHPNALPKSKLTESINVLDSKTSVELRTVLTQLAAGKKLSDAQLDAVDDGDSRLTAVIPILRAINDGAANAETKVAINALDSYAEPLKQILLSLAK
jgi:hypothetical protein